MVNKNVNVIKPYSVMKQQDQPVTKPKRWSNGVISGVPADTTDDEVKEETSAVMARRITRMVDGEIIPTRSVIIAFEDELPREVFVHLRRYRVECAETDPVQQMASLWTQDRIMCDCDSGLPPLLVKET